MEKKEWEGHHLMTKLTWKAGHWKKERTRMTEISFDQAAGNALGGDNEVSSSL